ncbi:Oligosaccharide translocation protein rft1 [Lambiella insularis]|nr:Oligosaccharide translocation protein rft1 [Lambiella insularis]
MVELLAEPCFVVVQLQMLYTLRASAETSATLTRCTLTCAMAIWASTSRQNLGVLPFAVGQSGYAIALVAVYYRSIGKTSYKQGFSIRPRILSAESAEYMFSLFYRPTLTLAINLYAQSGLKHLLTQGDSILIALFTSLSSQGVYALASNYGSLLARMLFQPVEESSRGVFARLLNATSSSASNDEKAEEMQVSKEKAIGEPRSATTTDSAAASDPALSARTYLITLLHLYALLSLAIVAVGPTAAPLLLRYVAGPAWVSAGTVLATYCYYIPLLALNGVLEAFVSAAATPTELRIQSAWMLVFSAGFAASGFVLLKVYDLGAKGLVAANAVNMVMRILWSWSFVTSFLRARRVTLVPTDCLPDPTSTGVGVLVASCLIVLSRSFSGSIMDLVKTGAVGAIYGLVLLYSERLFLYDCYLIVKPVSEPQIMQTANQNKERTLPSL